MIYVDELRYYDIKGPLKGWWCHMWSSDYILDLVALHDMAVKIGLNTKWFQHKNPAFLHYDLRPSKRILALENGAVFMPLREEIYRRTHL